jgi:hypothetical protein
LINQLRRFYKLKDTVPRWNVTSVPGCARFEIFYPSRAWKRVTGRYPLLKV